MLADGCGVSRIRALAASAASMATERGSTRSASKERSTARGWSVTLDRARIRSLTRHRCCVPPPAPTWPWPLI
ncbi:hypothetical protein DMB38_21340 [Streptomyces sp. WAC 06738]|nr:hypothetical protein DMB38_21340 [Streptomyces sp. WAC 06738]